MTHINDIKTRISQIWPQLSGGDGEWTIKTFKALEEIGHARNFEVRYSDKANNRSEWLWDLVWLSRKFEGGPLVGLELAVESEWTLRNVDYDFDKLLVAPAPIRLMIFQAPSFGEFERKADALYDRAMHCVTARGATFLLAGWIYESRAHRPEFRSWIV